MVPIDEGAQLAGARSTRVATNCSPAPERRRRHLIGEIVRTKLGHELAYTFIEPMVGGIQAGRIDELSALSVFPPLLEAARGADH
jgi:protoporphyrinogen oxidase